MIPKVCGGVFMTDKELSKLRRTELLEILFELRKQLDAARKENDDLRAEIEQVKSGTAKRTEQMVRRLYEERFGPFDEAVSGEADEGKAVSGEADEGKAVSGEADGGEADSAEDDSGEDAALEDKADE